MIRVAVLTTILLTTAAQAQNATVMVTNAWARATPPGAEVGAVYMTLRAPTADQFTGVSTPAAAKAEVQEMNVQNGVMSMRETPGIMLPANQPIVLGPGGFHVMLTGLAHPLRAGQTIPLHLTFADSAPVDVTATIQGVGAIAPTAAR